MKIIKTIKKAGYESLYLYNNPKHGLIKGLIIDLSLALLAFLIGCTIMIMGINSIN